MYNLLFKTKRLICLFAIMAYSTIAFSQTTTINYLTSGLSTSACNVFSPNVTVNGVSHSSYAGGVTFNSTYGISLGSSDNTTSNAGTAYVISYNFNAGYNYDISITASGDNAMHLKTSVVSDLNAFATSSMNSCTLDANVPNYYTTGYGQKDFLGTNASTTYTIPQFYIPNGLPTYLIIWASGGDPSLSLDAFSISKIVIIKSIPPPTFNITPSTVSLTCGTTSPVTFTVTNVYGTTGITNYTWNLGPASNNWLYNGSPAPQTISTSTTGSISLTPVCGKVQTNVYATVTANGNTYNTNTSAVSYTSITPTITGSSAFCSGTSSYQILGVPCNSTIVWSASPLNIVSFNPNGGNPITLTQTGNGIVTLNATITNDCSNQTVSKTITVGSPAPTFINGFGWNGYHFGGNLVYEFSVNPIPGITDFQWSVAGHANTIISGQGTDMIELLTQNVTHDSATLSLSVKWQNSCGWSSNLVRVGYIFPSGGAQIIIGPNPTQNVLNITTASNSANNITNNVKSSKSNYENQASIKAILVYNLNGVLLKQQEFGIGTVQAQISTGDLKNGTYIIKTITYDNYAESHLVNVIK